MENGRTDIFSFAFNFSHLKHILFWLVLVEIVSVLARHLQFSSSRLQIDLCLQQLKDWTIKTHDSNEAIRLWPLVSQNNEQKETKGCIKPETSCQMIVSLRTCHCSLQA